MSTTYTLKKQFDFSAPITPKVAGVLKMFGLDTQRLKESAVVHKCQLELSPGQICYLTGPSGSGKSVLFRELYSAVPENERINLTDIELPDDKTCVDSIDATVLETLGNLSKAGLSDCFTVLNTPANLSEGQKYRFRLAKALASGKNYIFADEFCSTLDRVSAAVVAYNIRNFADRDKVVFVLASSHDDLLADLRPEVLVIKHLAGGAEVIYRNKYSLRNI